MNALDIERDALAQFADALADAPPAVPCMVAPLREEICAAGS